MADESLVEKARARARSEFDKSTAGIRGAAQSFVTSRISMALAAALFISFTTTAIYFPDRLPPIGSPGLIRAGIIAPPPTLDLSTFDVSEADIRAKQNEALKPQATPVVQQGYDSAKAAVPHLPFYLDITGALLSFAALLYTLKIQVRAARNPTKSVAL